MFYIYAYLRTDGTPYYIGKGKGNSEETKAILREKRSKQVIIRTEETRRKISETRKLKGLRPASHKGIPKSERAKERMRKPKSKVTCPHCGKIGGSNIMYRYHFDNCKQKTIDNPIGVIYNG